MNSLIGELQRRNVHRAVVFYAGASWLLVQIATQVFPFFDIPNWAVRFVVIALLTGFPFAMLFSWFYEWTPEGIKRESEVERSQSITHLTGRKLDRWIIAVLSVAVVLLLANTLVLRKATTGTTDKSIAVLPFVNTGGEAGNEYFSDGLSEELIATLGRVHELKVIGRSSSFQFKNKTDDSKTIGEKLGVLTLLEGSVRKQDQHVRINVQLVNAVDGRQLWSESYDRDLKDIFAVQSEIAGTVANLLKVTLLGAGTQAAVPQNPNIEAYNALLQGNFFAQRRTAEDSRKAVGYYEEAIRLDPDYALAYSRLSSTAMNLATRYAGVGSAEGKEAIEKARTAADTALALEPNLADAHLALGNLLDTVDLDRAGAEKVFRRAAELAPQDPKLLQTLSIMKAELGRLDEAIELARRAIALDPLRAENLYNISVTLSALGRYDEAEAALNKAIELQPQAAQNFQQRAIIQILRGNTAAAVELAKQEPDPFWRTYGLSLALFANGDRVEADAQLKSMIDSNADDAGSQIASVYALRKEPDKVFEWLEHAWITHDPGVIELRFNPFILAYKDDPRFDAFAKKIGVMPVST